jgi:hypothetical protein
MFVQICPNFALSNGFYANEVIDVQMNDTIFILSTQLICAKFHFETPYRWGTRGANKQYKQYSSNYCKTGNFSELHEWAVLVKI